MTRHRNDIADLSGNTVNVLITIMTVLLSIIGAENTSSTNTNDITNTILLSTSSATETIDIELNRMSSTNDFKQITTESDDVTSITESIATATITLSTENTPSSRRLDDESTTVTSLPITSTTILPLVTTNGPVVHRHKIIHQRPYQSSKHHHEHHYGPFFEGPLNATTNGTILVGVHLYTEGIFNCRVGMLKDKTVMWVRRTADKFSLLTVGNITYSGDPRIKVTFQYPNNWRLHINPMQKDDAGLYMCQVSTHPPRVFATNVVVLPPAIRVVDEQGYEIRDRYYKIGSTIDLSCQVALSYLNKNTSSIADTSMPMPYKTSTASIKENLIDVPVKPRANHNPNDNFYKRIIWKKDGANVSKDALFNLSTNGGWIISRMSILSAERTHSGVYSCSISNKTTAIVDVQILNGETPAAVQHSGGHRLHHTWINFQLLAFIIPVVYISC